MVREPRASARVSDGRDAQAAQSEWRTFGVAPVCAACLGSRDGRR